MSVWNSASLVAQYIMMQIKLLICLHIHARTGDIEPGLIADCNWQLFPEAEEGINCLSLLLAV